jgi:hypothetical protein
LYFPMRPHKAAVVLANLQIDEQTEITTCENS